MTAAAAEPPSLDGVTKAFDEGEYLDRWSGSLDLGERRVSMPSKLVPLVEVILGVSIWLRGVAGIAYLSPPASSIGDHTLFSKALSAVPLSVLTVSFRVADGSSEVSPFLSSFI
jgi:hypothetical protein